MLNSASVPIPDREPRLIPIPRVTDESGSLCVVDWAETLPFSPARFYFVYDVAPGARRAGHAHFLEEELIVCLNGAFRILTDDGSGRREFHLDRAEMALHIPPLVWHSLDRFTPGAVCAVFASGRYNQDDYCRDYQRFLETIKDPTR